MEDFAEHNFPWHKLEQLNACCMYLQVTTLAEVTNHTGMELSLKHSSHWHSPAQKAWTPSACQLYNGQMLHFICLHVVRYGPQQYKLSTPDHTMANAYNNHWVHGCPAMHTIDFGIGICPTLSTCSSNKSPVAPTCIRLKTQQ